MAPLCEHRGEVDGRRGLADAALAAADGEDGRGGVGPGDRRDVVVLPEAADEGLALVLGHRPEVDLHLGDLGEAVLELGRQDLLEERLQGAAGDREGQVHRDAGSLQVDAADHIELDDAPVDLRIVDLGEDGADLVDGGHASRVAEGGLGLRLASASLSLGVPGLVWLRLASVGRTTLEVRVQRTASRPLLPPPLGRESRSAIRLRHGGEPHLR